MTREEALNKAINIVRYFEAHFAKSKEAREDAVNIIEALEQEPSGDLISRQAVHEAITRWAGSMSVLVALPTREVRPLLDSIHKLPSVKPQEKTGYREYNDIYDHYLCGNCKTVVMDYDNFCPNCGARMVEPQEIEDREGEQE